VGRVGEGGGKEGKEDACCGEKHDTWRWKESERGEVGEGTIYREVEGVDGGCT